MTFVVVDHGSNFSPAICSLCTQYADFNINILILNLRKSKFRKFKTLPQPTPGQWLKFRCSDSRFYSINHHIILLSRWFCFLNISTPFPLLPHYLSSRPHFFLPETLSVSLSISQVFFVSIFGAILKYIREHSILWLKNLLWIIIS